ncbi:hypothetical protein NSPZN2_100385 [Nitrospira defluvii]|uniref:Uncharacterized protein n=1 Tax=Nitrospira defluvii TaxID=330214 RepID=A0ABM8R3X0_9BACT|nr:hypothetical protein NSPZN2_100385 [Nitrospira defluvii]
MVDGRVRINISRQLNVFLLSRRAKAEQLISHYHKGGSDHVDDVQYAGMHAETRNVRARTNDARHDGHAGGRRSGLLASGIAGASLDRPLEPLTAWYVPLSEAGRITAERSVPCRAFWKPKQRLEFQQATVSCLTAARPYGS